MAVKHIPDGYHAVTPYLIVEDAEKLIAFMTDVFGAKERMRLPGPNGVVGHAEMEIGDSVVMLADSAGAENNIVMPAMINVYVEDCDAAYNRALAAGAMSDREPADQFYGDRNAGVVDPFGNRWFIATHVEDVSPEEMHRRSDELLKQQGQA